MMTVILFRKSERGMCISATIRGTITKQLELLFFIVRDWIKINMLATHETNVDRSTLLLGTTLTLIFYIIYMKDDNRIFNNHSSRIQLTSVDSDSSFYHQKYSTDKHGTRRRNKTSTSSSLDFLPCSKEKSGIPGYFESDYKYCVANNEVLDRGDNYGTVHESRLPYSISNYTFSTFHNKSICSSLPETLQAIKYGTRKWIDPTKQYAPSLVREKFQSYFVPDQCDLPYLSAQEACSIMSQFSHVFTIGDSFTRHLRQALLITLRRDLILGGIEALDKHRENNPYDCRCDGQFSEHAHCRQNDHFFDEMTPRDLNLCSELPDKDQFQFNFEWNWTSVDCSQTGTKSVLLLLQAAAHFAIDVYPTMNYFVIPHLDHPNIRRCADLNKLRVLWVAFSSQSRSLDKRYPHQSRENATLFNEEMNAQVQEAIPNVTIIEWWNLTLDAQTSDGFHFLTDVNLLKANHFLHVIKYLAY
jgi:hypothetical protein